MGGGLRSDVAFMQFRRHLLQHHYRRFGIGSQPLAICDQTWNADTATVEAAAIPVEEQISSVAVWSRSVLTAPTNVPDRAFDPAVLSAVFSRTKTKDVAPIVKNTMQQSEPPVLDHYFMQLPSGRPGRMRLQSRWRAGPYLERFTTKSIAVVFAKRVRGNNYLNAGIVYGS